MEDLQINHLPLLEALGPMAIMDPLLPDPLVLKACPLATPLCTTDPLALPALLVTLLDHRCPVRQEEHQEDPQDLPLTTHTQTHECQEEDLLHRPTASPMEFQDREANRPTRSTWVPTTLCSP